jgi:hypothetical protein
MDSLSGTRGPRRWLREGARDGPAHDGSRVGASDDPPSTGGISKGEGRHPVSRGIESSAASETSLHADEAARAARSARHAGGAAGAPPPGSRPSCRPWWPPASARFPARRPEGERRLELPEQLPGERRDAPSDTRSSTASRGARLVAVGADIAPVCAIRSRDRAPAAREWRRGVCGETATPQPSKWDSLPYRRVISSRIRPSDPFD